MQGSFIRRIVGSATTDAAEWTLIGNSIGWSAAVAVYKEAAGGGGGTGLGAKRKLLLGVG
jgi:hypothetical protein